MDEDEYIKKNNIVEKNYDVMDISELNDELIKARKTLTIIEKTIQNKKKDQNIAKKLFKK